MSEGHIDPPAEDRAAPAVLEPGPAEEGPAAASVRPGRARAKGALWLAALLVLLVAAAALSPFWSQPVARLLPWGGATAAAKYDALTVRVAALEQRPAPATIDVDTIKSAQAATAQRVAGLETAVNAVRENQEEASATKAALARLTQRTDTLEAQSASRAAAETAEIKRIEQEQARRSAASSDLAARIAALEHQIQSRENVDRTGAVLVLALLQMREAVDEARPFPTEYAAFKQLATVGDPDLTAAAAPLAQAAQDGVASRAVLRQRLADLGEQIAAAKMPATKPNWWEQALDRLRGLVTIRRIDGAAKTGPEAVVDAAQSALAQDDLPGAIAALEKLTGGDAAAAQSWLRMARRRLAAETALRHLQQLLTARLGAATAASPAAPAPSAVTAPTPAPAAAPAQPPVAPKKPS